MNIEGYFLYSKSHQSSKYNHEVKSHIGCYISKPSSLKYAHFYKATSKRIRSGQVTWNNEWRRYWANFLLVAREDKHESEYVQPDTE